MPMGLHSDHPPGSGVRASLSWMAASSRRSGRAPESGGRSKCSPGWSGMERQRNAAESGVGGVKSTLPPILPVTSPPPPPYDFMPPPANLAWRSRVHRGWPLTCAGGRVMLSRLDQYERALLGEVVENPHDELTLSVLRRLATRPPRPRRPDARRVHQARAGPDEDGRSRRAQGSPLAGV